MLLLNTVNWNININDVQEYWNKFELKFIEIVDDIVPLVDFESDVVKIKPPNAIKNKINKRNILLKSFRANTSSDLKWSNASSCS